MTIVAKVQAQDGHTEKGKAPNDVVEQVKAKHSRLQEKQKKLESNLNRIKEMKITLDAEFMTKLHGLNMLYFEYMWILRAIPEVL